MGKKTAGGLLGSILVAGVTLGVAKYLKDYAGVRFTDDKQIDKVKTDSNAVREAAKRTYIAIKEKSAVKEAAAELSKAAGSVVNDAADIAKTAGSETVNAFKDMKSKYEDNPETFRAEVSDNLNDMTQNIVKATQDKTEELVDRIKSAYNDFDVYEVVNDDSKSEPETQDLSDGTTEETSSNDDSKESSDSSEDNKSSNVMKSSESDNGETVQTESEKKAETDDGSFTLHFVDDDKDENGSNVTITEDAE